MQLQTASPLLVVEDVIVAQLKTNRMMAAVQM